MNSYKINRTEIKENTNLIFNEKVKMIRQGKNICDILSFKYVPDGNFGIKRISKNEYIDIQNGEVMQYNLNSGKSTDSLLKTFTKMRYIINANFNGGLNELFLTLTYAENMQDWNRFYLDVKNFVKRLKYYHKKELAYIIVVEPQGRGALHGHILIKNVDGSKLHIDYRKLHVLWQFGMSKIERLTTCDNIGAYLTAYLSNAPATDESVGGGIKKNIIKGMRLKMYPKNVNYFRCSRNIARPEVVYLDYSEVINEYGNPQMITQYEIAGDDDNTNNYITKMHFNKLRKDDDK